MHSALDKPAIQLRRLYPPVEPAEQPLASQANQLSEEATQELLASADPIDRVDSELAESGDCVDVSGESLQSPMLVSTLDYERYLAGY